MIDVFRETVPSGWPSGGIILKPKARASGNCRLIVGLPSTGLSTVFGKWLMAIASFVLVAWLTSAS